MESALKDQYPELFARVEGVEYPLVYVPKFREFGIDVLDGGTSFLVINYCPWTGKKLPASVRDKWFDILWDELKMDVDDDGIPQEMFSEEWWIKRNL